jgi:hypothetical protein
MSKSQPSVGFFPMMIIAMGLMVVGMGAMFSFIFSVWIGGAVVVVFLPIIVAVYIFIRKALGSSVNAKKILAEGKSATAEIVSVKDTGVTMNDNPMVELELRIKPADEPPFAATTRTLVSRLNPKRYAPGGVTLVKYLPTDKTQVAVDVDAKPFTRKSDGAPADESVVELVTKQQAECAQISLTGARARATITDIRDTNTLYYLGNEVLALDLEVEPVGESAFRATTIAIVAKESRGKLAKGAVVTVKYNPTDRRRVCVTSADFGAV